MRFGRAAFCNHQQIVLTIAPRGRVLQTRNLWIGVKLGNNRRDPLHRWFAVNFGLACPQISTGVRVVIDNHHAGTAAAGDQRRQQPARTTPHDKNITIPITRLEMLARDLVIGRSCKASRPAD